MKIVFVGAGNLATRLSADMNRTGMHILQIYSRTAQHAETLAKIYGCSWTNQLDKIVLDADLYVFALKDAVLPEVLAKMQPNNGFWVHTAGSVPMQIFEKYTSRYGVLYPLQTFSKERMVDFNLIPFFIEANTPENELVLCKIARAMSEKVQTLSSEKRKILHLAAVFACNFANHMYTLAGEILEEQALSFDVLLPLINETAAKVQIMSPKKAQTGPAVRYDENVIRKHLDMLSNPDTKVLYELISKSIYKTKIDE